MMYSGLLDYLGDGNNLTGVGNRREPEKHVVASFKAGKMNMELKEVCHFLLYSKPRIWV